MRKSGWRAPYENTARFLISARAAAFGRAVQRHISVGRPSKRNLIAASLFADGAAAVLVDGDAASTGRLDAGLQIIGTQSTLAGHHRDHYGLGYGRHW